MIRDPQDLADELTAERAYADMLAYPKTGIDAPDLFGGGPFDRCNREQHYALCGPYRPFERCPFGSHWHYVDDGFTAYRFVGKCPNASEYSEPAEQACEPPETEG